jgi:DNA-binding NtrC family response regulator
VRDRFLRCSPSSIGRVRRGKRNSSGQRLIPAARNAGTAEPLQTSGRETTTVSFQESRQPRGVRAARQELTQPERAPTSVPRAASNDADRSVGAEFTLAEMERAHIVAVLKRHGGNRSRAAEALGIPRRTLYRRLEEYGIS